MDIPVLVMNGEDDQNVPIANATLKSVKLLKNEKLIDHLSSIPHRMPTTEHHISNKDLLEFIRS